MSSSDELLALLARPPQSEADAPARDDAGDLVAFVRTARDAWPGVTVGDATFVAFIASRLAEGSLAAALAELRAADLYVACACAQGDAGAIRAFEDAYFREVDAAHARVRPPIAAGEARQVLRERLFVAREASPPAIASYSGRGDVRSWLRVTAIRALMNVATRTKKDVELADHLIERLGASGDDPEWLHIRRVAGAGVEAAFAAATSSLDRRERTLLRYAYVDGLTVDAIASIYDVHRATAARWVASARESLATRTKELLKERLQLDDAEMSSLLRALDSQFDMSVARYLASSSIDEP